MIGMEHFLELWASHAVAVVLEHAGTLEFGWKYQPEHRLVTHMGVSINGMDGLKWTTVLKRMIGGVPPKLGNLHMDIQYIFWPTLTNHMLFLICCCVSFYWWYSCCFCVSSKSFHGWPQWFQVVWPIIHGWPRWPMATVWDTVLHLGLKSEIRVSPSVKFAGQSGVTMAAWIVTFGRSKKLLWKWLGYDFGFTPLSDILSYLGHWDVFSTSPYHMWEIWGTLRWGAEWWPFAGRWLVHASEGLKTPPGPGDAHPIPTHIFGPQKMGPNMCVNPPLNLLNSLGHGF